MNQLIDKRDAEVEHVRRELCKLVELKELTPDELELRNDFPPGDLAQALAGEVPMTVSVLCGVLLHLETSPARFFARVVGRYELRQAVDEVGEETSADHFQQLDKLSGLGPQTPGSE
jgi:hypothetical protein